MRAFLKCDKSVDIDNFITGELSVDRMGKKCDLCRIFEVRFQ